MRRKEMRKKYYSLKNDPEGQKEVMREYLEEKNKTFLGCCAILFFILIFLALIAWIVAILRFIF